ncbi:MAG: hypothetical protein AAF223_07010, partial [Bacteroidota bacterium]
MGIIFFWYRHTQFASWFLPAISLKIVYGWLVGIIYSLYYSGGDTWNYFADGVTLANLARADWIGYLSSWFNADDLPQTLIYLRQPR